MAKKRQPRRILPKIINEAAFKAAGLTTKIILSGVRHTYKTLDAIDKTLIGFGSDRLAKTVELANLSSVVGNIFGASLANESGGRLKRNGPHKYPDLLAKKAGCKDIEIKVALETNKPKGHHPKAGFYVTIRYVLGLANGTYSQGKASRGDVVWIWEMRAGHLKKKHFNLSNTAGDSGKTAVINSDGMAALTVILCDIKRCPYPVRGRLYASFKSLVR